MRKRAYFSSQLTSPESLIDLTPLIDVVFVVLIMFIVVAPLIELDQIELAPGLHSTLEDIDSIKENENLTIRVYADNSIVFQKETLTSYELQERLKGIKGHYPYQNPKVIHDKAACFGTYQEVKNAVEGAGFEQMDVILKPGS